MAHNKEKKPKKRVSKKTKELSSQQLFKKLRAIFDSGLETFSVEDITHTPADNRAFFTECFKILKKYNPVINKLKGQDYDECITACFQEYIDWQISKFTTTRTITIKAEELFETLANDKPDKKILQ